MRAYTLRVRARTKETEMARKKSKQKQKVTEKRIGFGKYSGTRWRDLPTEYLKWVCRETWEPSSHALASQVLLARGVKDFHRQQPRQVKRQKSRHRSDPVLPQLDQEYRSIVGS